MSTYKLKPISRDWIQWFFAFLGGVILLLVVAPLLGMMLHTTPQELWLTAKDQAVSKSMALTLCVSMVGTIFFSSFAIPFAYFLARRDFPLKRVVVGIVNLPIVIPHTAAGIAVLGVLSRDSFLGGMADSVGFRFIDHPLGIMVAMAFVSIPFLINSARDGFLSVPERLEKAAFTLGASPLRVFFTISLPLAWRSILSGLILMWARGLSEFGAVVIVAYHPMITPVLIYERFTSFGLSYARPVSVLFVLVCLCIFIVLRTLGTKKEKC